VVEAASFDACLGIRARRHLPSPSERSCLYGGNPAPLGADGLRVRRLSDLRTLRLRNPDGSGGITRIRSSYQTRAITQRHTLPDGTVLTPAQYGPDVSGTYPLGYYAEDHEYVSGLGDLDAYNGRFAVTPEYPSASTPTT